MVRIPIRRKDGIIQRYQIKPKKKQPTGRWEVYSTYEHPQDAHNSINDFKEGGVKAKMVPVSYGYAVYQFIEKKVR